MRSLFATPRSRWLARLLLYGTALGVGLPTALSQQLVGVLRQPTGPAPAPWQELGLVSADGLRRAPPRPVRARP